MLIGQRAEQNERQKRLKKSRMYKEMLDSQLIINQKYKKDNMERSFYQGNSSPQADAHIMPIIDNKKPDNMDSSFVYQIANSKVEERGVNLPSLKDKNTYYRGSSKFIKIDEPVMPNIKKRHVRTEQIDEESDEDQYNSTCQRIIRELQSIIKQPVKQKLRKRYNEYTEFSNYKRNIPRNRSNQPIEKEQENRQNRENREDRWNRENRDHRNDSFDYLAQNINLKSSHNPEMKMGKNNMYDEASKRSVNEFDESPPAEPVKKTTDKKTNKDGLMSTEARIADNSSKNKFVSSFQEIDSLPKKTALRNSPNLSTSHADRMKTEIGKSTNANSQTQRQNFLQVLRKVKNRGESLFLKLSKYPSGKVNDKQ